MRVDFWGITIGAAIASAAWLYQRAWEHQEKRINRYQEIVDRLPAFTTASLNPEIMKEAMREGRRLWLSAPDDVVLAYEKLLDLSEGKIIDPKEEILGCCIEDMRSDATFSAALFPRFWQTRLCSHIFRLRSPREQSNQ